MERTGRGVKCVGVDVRVVPGVRGAGGPSSVGESAADGLTMFSQFHAYVRARCGLVESNRKTG